MSWDQKQNEGIKKILYIDVMKIKKLNRIICRFSTIKKYVRGAAAEQSLKEIDSIAATIQEAAEKTDQAGRHLNDAESNSHLAFDMARTSTFKVDKLSNALKSHWFSKVAAFVGD